MKLRALAPTMLFAACGWAALAAQDGVSDIGSDRWTVEAGKTVEFLGRKAFIGSATLKDVEFGNGVIEFDVAVPAGKPRSYPGIVFRARPDGSWERFYIRPHRSPYYPDVLQYVAAFNGVDAWQLYYGPGNASAAPIPANQWFRVKVEVFGSQARVFLADSPSPALVVPRLRHGTSRGGVGVNGPMDGSAYFSNFSLRSDETLSFDPPPPVDEVPGVVRDWKVSKPFPAGAVDLEAPPEAQGLGDMAWRDLSSEPSGLVDVSRRHARSGEPDLVFAKATIESDRAEVRKYDLGYSDIVTVFLNGTPVFTGDSRYQGRDQSFLGIVGWNDAVYLPLRKGRNELTLAVAEAQGGWGFMVRDGRATFAAEGLAPAWETPKRFAIPESAAYDAPRERLYVSSFDALHPSGAEGKQAIARLKLDGTIESPRWVDGLANPTGLAVVADRLFAVERAALAEIDIPSARIVARHAIPGPILPNDVAAGPDGTLYVSDGPRATIFRKAPGGAVEEWLRDPRLGRVNGVGLDGSKLVAVTSIDGTLKSIDLQSKEIRTLARLGAGTLDGLEVAGPGVYLVSHNEGRLWRVTADGTVSKLLDLTVTARGIADFAYVPAGGLIVIPTFADNRVVAYKATAKAVGAASASDAR